MRDDMAAVDPTPTDAGQHVRSSICRAGWVINAGARTPPPVGAIRRARVAVD
jgi:hypothetical protein